MWIVLSLLSALFESAKDTFGKLSVNKTDEYTSAFSLHLFTLTITIPMGLLAGIPTLKPEFWWGSLLFLPITPLWSVSYMKALKLSPLSEVLPMMAFNPIFTALLSFLFQGKPIAFTGWVGIMCISLGMYAVYLKPEILKRGILYPLTAAFSNKGAHHMLIVAFLWSIGAYLSKWRVTGSDPLFSTMSSGFIGVVTTYFLAAMLNKRIKIKQYFSNGWSLLPIGIFYYLASITSSYALTTGPAAYVFSIKRGSIVASAITGKLIFKEIIFTAKIFGLIIICLGIFLLSV
jgi:uncharacterized membrane protein